MDLRFSKAVRTVFFFLLPLAFLGCAAPASIRPAEPQPKKDLQYPVVLVHGIATHDRGSVIRFWGRIPETLEKNGVQVHFGNTDAWGSIESNAEILKTTIDKVLVETGSEKINIIAHSKGGLDSRYLIWKYDYGGKVASLTTISTPHRGAELADLLFSQDFIHTEDAKKNLEAFGKMYGDINPDLYNVNYQLTTGNMQEFNKTVGADGRVFYQSMYTIMHNSFDDVMFYRSHQYIKNVAGDNDGIVSEYSARWGDNIVKIEGSISHTEMMDYKMRKISGVDIPDIYLRIIDTLVEQGC